MPTQLLPVQTSRTIPASMPNTKKRIALYLHRPIDLDAYVNLIEIATHSAVVVRSTSCSSLGVQMTACGADAALLDSSLITREVRQELAYMTESKPIQIAAICAPNLPSHFSSGLPTSVDRVSDARQLVRWLNDESADGATDAAPVFEVPSLTKREREVWQLIAQGQAVREIARTLQLAESTVDSHKSRLMKKLCVHKSVDLVRLAIRYGLICL